MLLEQILFFKAAFFWSRFLPSVIFLSSFKIFRGPIFVVRTGPPSCRRRPCAWACAAVGRTAQEVVNEVRRQFIERPGIMDYKEKPDYGRCVSIVASASLREMIKPGALAIISPIIVGFLFRMLGQATGHRLLGAKVVASMLMFATVAGILMALFLNTAGGAWDNAKKYIETGALGGKGSDCHKAAVTGDTVGDPFKDTAGPSLHVLIKMLATITLVMAPVFL